MLYCIPLPPHHHYRVSLRQPCLLLTLPKTCSASTYHPHPTQLRGWMGGSRTGTGGTGLPFPLLNLDRMPNSGVAPFPYFPQTLPHPGSWVGPPTRQFFPSFKFLGDRTWAQTPTPPPEPPVDLDQYPTPRTNKHWRGWPDQTC